MPELMDLLDLRGSIITSDALNTQKKTVEKAIECGADYVLRVKENHSGLQEKIETNFDAAIKKTSRGPMLTNTQHSKKIAGGLKNEFIMPSRTRTYPAKKSGLA